MRILLLNPPGKKRYLRDCYCSTVSKGAYVWHPADLLSVSGLLREKNEISVLDCIAEEINPKDSLRKIKEISPQIIYTLVSTLSINEDIEFICQVKREIKKVNVICSGEPILSPDFAEKNRVFDVLVYNYTNPEIGNIVEILERIEDSHRVIGKGEKNKDFLLGIPCHEVFKKDKYWIPFVRLPFATLITDFGCPFGCRFCNSNFHYAKRDEDEVLEDIRIIAKLGYKHIFIKDMTFLLERERSIKFAAEISKYRMTFNCYSRIDLVDNDLMSELKEMGLLLIQFGIEDYDESVLLSEEKRLSIEQAISVFRYLRSIGVYTGAHFIFGLPSKKRAQDFTRLLALINMLRPSYVSFNLFSPRLGSYYAKENLSIRERDKKFYNVGKLYVKSLFASPTLIFDPLEDINKDNFFWYLKSIFNLLKGT